MSDEKEDGPPMSRPHNHQPGWGLVQGCPSCEAWCDDVIDHDPTAHPRAYMTLSKTIEEAQHRMMVHGIGVTQIVRKTKEELREIYGEQP